MEYIRKMKVTLIDRNGFSMEKSINYGDACCQLAIEPRSNDKKEYSEKVLELIEFELYQVVKKDNKRVIYFKEIVPD
jgi:hypothetical protein